MDKEERLKAARGSAQRRLDEVLRLLCDGQGSLVELMVRAGRLGLDSEKAQAAFTAVMNAAADGWENYQIAVATPEPRIRSHRVELCAPTTGTLG